MLNFVKQWIMDTLGFSKTEANGTLVLIFITILIAIVPRAYLLQAKSHDGESFQANEESLTQWAAELESYLALKAPEKQPLVPEKKPAEAFDFDPNSIGEEGLLALGFSERASRNLLRYRESGGQFAVKADMKRIYGISATRVDELWEHITLPEEESERTIAAAKRPEKAPPEAIVKFDINMATAAELQVVRGIGPVLSERIVTYRDRLGGFHHPGQLGEVYGLKPEVVEVLMERVSFSGGVRQIDINTDSLSYLYRHPYINYNTARAIFNYRKQHGRLDSVAQIKPIKIISDSLYQRIYPYLSHNP